jgi:2-amino-4-hydroxy-6-hydroxymethyldihydropteridine diphosphokinase
MDIDILYFNMEQINQVDLVVPHPRMHQRAFVLAPLCEIAPKLKHPILGQNTQQLLNQLPH